MPILVVALPSLGSLVGRRSLDAFGDDEIGVTLSVLTPTDAGEDVELLAPGLRSYGPDRASLEAITPVDG